MNALTFDCPTSEEENRIREEHEYTFSCPICLCPKSRMVYGRCQHSICAECLYGEMSLISLPFTTCPLCNALAAFPVLRPSIPDSNIKLQRAVGVCACPNSLCGEELWKWDLEKHVKKCKWTPKRKRGRPPKPKMNPGEVPVLKPVTPTRKSKRTKTPRRMSAPPMNKATPTGRPPKRTSTVSLRSRRSLAG